jgi:hypothetical protein
MIYQQASNNSDNNSNKNTSNVINILYFFPTNLKHLSFKLVSQLLFNSKD